MEIEAGLLSVILTADGHMSELNMWVGLSYCGGDWKKLSLAKRGSLIFAAVDDWAEEVRGEAARLSVDSALYLGGVPMELHHPALRSHRHGEMYSKESTKTMSALKWRPRIDPGCLVGFAANSIFLNTYTFFQSLVWVHSPFLHESVFSVVRVLSSVHR